MLAMIPASESWGVNGLSEAAAGFCCSDRTVSWQANVEDESILPLARTLTVVHSWAPRNRVLDILRQLIEQGKDFAAAIAAVAALV